MRPLLLCVLFSTACDPGVKLSDVTLAVDFDRPNRAALVPMTPAEYEVGLQFASLLGETDFDLFEGEGGALEAFAYSANSPTPISLALGDTVIPDEPYESVDLGIVYLQMVLPFRLDATGQTETRTLRIYFEPTGAYLPGDVTVVGDDTQLWAFGPGNVGGDPLLEGLPRADAYNTPAWPDGRDTATSGPFGNSAFWDVVPRDPFHWVIDLDPAIEDAAEVTVRVADTWHYTDQAEDGVYDWPADYGNDWHMDFPEIVALP